MVLPTPSAALALRGLPSGIAFEINHNHLHYFWLVGRHGSLTAAAAALGLAQPTVGAQIRALERQLGVSLVTRRGRSLHLTEAGQAVFRHADEMFRIAAEIPAAIQGSGGGAVRALHVGTSDFVPKPIVRSILEPLLRKDPEARLVCHEWSFDHLISELSLFNLDLVLADRPHPGGAGSNAVSHPVFESSVAFFARPALARRLRREFPASLHGARVYLPVRGTSLREALERWFDANSVRPVISGEFEDRELLKTFGAGGLAAFPAATAIERDTRHQYGVERVGWVRGVRETYWAIAVRRRVMHPLVQRLVAGASETLRSRA